MTTSVRPSAGRAKRILVAGFEGVGVVLIHAEDHGDATFLARHGARATAVRQGSDQPTATAVVRSAGAGAVDPEVRVGQVTEQRVGADVAVGSGGVGHATEIGAVGIDIVAAEHGGFRTHVDPVGEGGAAGVQGDDVVADLGVVAGDDEAGATAEGAAVRHHRVCR